MVDTSTDIVLSQPTRFQADRANRSPHIHVIDITLEYHGHRLLEAADLHLISGRVYGLVAANGAGKTSLLRSIADRRLMNFPHYLEVGYVEQETAVSACTALEFTLQVLTERSSTLEHQEEELLAREDIDSDEVQQQLQTIYEELDRLETRGQQSAEEALHSAGFTQAHMRQRMDELSGGWRKKAALARAFVFEPDVLLLDEPTNHLDMQSIAWLEHMVERFLTPERTVLVVTHDVSFMNNVCTDTVVLNDLRLSYHSSNYADFLLYLQVQKKNHEHQLEQQGRCWKRERERESVCVCVCGYLCVHVCMCVCVCVCVCVTACVSRVYVFSVDDQASLSLLGVTCLMYACLTFLATRSLTL
jgi:ATPase subunit of ABC transporter with duplicated ATPase domains